MVDFEKAYLPVKWIIQTVFADVIIIDGFDVPELEECSGIGLIHNVINGNAERDQQYSWNKYKQYIK